MLKAAKLPPPPKTTLELNLGVVESLETLDILDKLTRNVAQNPRDEKFRKLRLTNEKIHKLIVEAPGALPSLQVLGWVEGEEEGFIVLPPSVQLTMKEVRDIDAARKNLTTKLEKARKARLAAKQAAHDPEKARLLAQLEADKRERATKAPVTEASKATARGSANIMTAGELGINKSSGG
mmetsp:Transcript_22885/g.27661  ORF Transcript_22885/g.27661 Transcript_22885/m.27661 type:complete len:180 (+) Transcript_22885:148-687(+)|eukprot:CAMPEP_0197850686 /NCGR_PEP_ID=MMETSP1438-20131217/16065_1 /TAXON_ID=1461541 /ORGANISM="Pterosperma sp., Strain CCMP1384" /LENGTH=179 /DNA_ID=CAMNT_0043463977 /DNA_START=148 /DNA_END=687 /DNA_ORIENTATION=+